MGGRHPASPLGGCATDYRNFRASSKLGWRAYHGPWGAMGFLHASSSALSDAWSTSTTDARTSESNAADALRGATGINPDDLQNATNAMGKGGDVGMALAMDLAMQIASAAG